MYHQLVCKENTAHDPASLRNNRNLNYFECFLFYFNSDRVIFIKIYAGVYILIYVVLSKGKSNIFLALWINNWMFFRFRSTLLSFRQYMSLPFIIKSSLRKYLRISSLFLHIYNLISRRQIHCQDIYLCFFIFTSIV